MRINNLNSISFNVIAFMVMAFALASCATIHSENFATQINSKTNKNRTVTEEGIKVSCEENDRLSSKNFGLIRFTFENTTSDWIEVKNLQFSLGNSYKDGKIKIPTGQDLEAWANATQTKLNIDQYNFEIAMFGLRVVSSGVGTIGAILKNKGAKSVAAIGNITTGIASVANTIDTRTSELENSRLYPGYHLLAGDFKIPPGLFVDKFIVINTKDDKELGYIDEVFLTYKTGNGKIEQLKLRFRDDRTSNSTWQGHLSVKDNEGTFKGQPSTSTP
jgi:hypothetical protein